MGVHLLTEYNDGCAGSARQVGKVLRHGWSSGYLRVGMYIYTPYIICIVYV